jgi:hypothetical protein
VGRVARYGAGVPLVVAAARRGRTALLAVVLPLALAGCGSPGPARWTAGPTGSPSASPLPSGPASTAPAIAPSATRAAPQVTPAGCRFAAKEEVSAAIGQPVYGWIDAIGCWYLLGPPNLPAVDIHDSVQIVVWRGRVTQRDEGELVVSGLGGNAYWNPHNGNLEVEVGRDVLSIYTRRIRAADKLAAAKALATIARKRL